MRFLLIIIFVLPFSSITAQVLVEKKDSGKSNRLEITGYFQPQFPVSSKKGVETHCRGDCKLHSYNGLLVRRSRIKPDFVHLAMTEKTSFTEFTSDIPDNIFTARLQFHF